LKNYYFIAGEASGDLHAAKVISELSEMHQSKAKFKGFGGDKMKAAGMSLSKHYKDLAFMGFLEVIKNLSTIKKNFDLAQSEILHFKTDVLVLIDYPGFNMRIAKFAKKHEIKVVYYITPQVWAWKKSRVKDLKKYTDLLIPILPFEKQFFKDNGLDSIFVGHPLLDELKQNHKKAVESEKPLIALLPGSRKQEISKILPLMLEVTSQFEDYEFVIAGAPSIPLEFYRNITKDSFVPISSGRTYEVLMGAKAALIASGTATLEAAILNVPQVVCYKTSMFSYTIGRLLVKVKYISLVNLISDKFVVKELIQSDFNVVNLKIELKNILNKKTKSELLSKYKLLHEMLGEVGASKRVAEAIFNLE
jgi:lipid-A-disaccharide synthase